jgi:ketosteroid isomerase-like protein
MTPDAWTYARAWEQAWNAHDLDALLAHFAEDAVFTSPFAERVIPGCRGVVRGKAALRDYWGTALERNPALHFELTSVFAGVDCLLIGFRTEAGIDRFEVLRFRDGLVVEGHGTFPIAAA